MKGVSGAIGRFCVDIFGAGRGPPRAGGNIRSVCIVAYLISYCKFHVASSHWRCNVADVLPTRRSN